MAALRPGAAAAGFLTDMQVADFRSFFRQLHGLEPFRWQIRLLRHILGEGWPDFIDLPTSFGKTCVIEIAVFLLALGAKPAARRIFLAVDRRLVVDQIGAHARKIARKLRKARTGAVRLAADRLRALGGDFPLTAVTLRGGLEYERPWCRNPAQPIVAVCTVDQLGSRLLFRAYSCTKSRRPIEAGLAGNDALLIADEAHLSQPFIDTAKRLRDLGADIRLTQMSATPRVSDGSVFSWQPSEDMLDPILRQRVVASKPARLVETQNLVRSAVAEARAMPGPAVGVILNTIGAVRQVFEQLDGEKALLIGPVRPAERKAVLEKWLPLIAAGRRRSDRRIYCVSTQGIEAGPDIDFDSLVTEAAPLDVLRQRFGRLDRRGERGSTQAAILRDPGRNFVPYGRAVERTWRWLRARRPMSETESVDFGVLAMHEMLARFRDADLLTPSPRAPALLPAYLDAWQDTRSDSVPDAAPFLHGTEALDADEIQLVWRADLGADWAAAVRAAPPDSREAMPLPLRALKRWLRRRAEAFLPAQGLRWRGLTQAPSVVDGGKGIRPGDTVVVPSNYGGSDAFGWNPDSLGPVPDIGNSAGGWRRIHPSLFAPAAKETIARRIRLLGAADEAIDAEALQELVELTGLDGVDLASAEAYPGGIALRIRPPRRRGNSAKEVTLAAHSYGVEQWVLQFAAACGVTSEEVEALGWAGQYHDLGKWDLRVQAIFHGGNFVGAARAIDGKQPLAKSLFAQNYSQKRLVRRAAGYPRRARHEAASVKLAEELGACELTLHLIASHHGHGRPWLPAWDDDHGITAHVDGREVTTGAGGELGCPDSPQPERFRSLALRHGAWKLAYLETILRLADQRQSADERQARSTHDQ
ncbi:MAG: type I-U CRISPR-associated helicase/endonuclease Cas3 [Bryobacteraceae bacterium]|nr:type I-U CRISPR-associated helicase/endonuclease Cas3 [Bryobacteraceae bacterium]